MTSENTLTPYQPVVDGSSPQYSSDMGPYGFNLSVEALAKQEEKADAKLQAARDSFPEWDIYETFGGFMAVPKGTTILQSTELDALLGKLPTSRSRSKWQSG